MWNHFLHQLKDLLLILNNLFQVSWIRKRDSHILTVDSTTFISDDRFYILKPERRHVWTLRIRWVRNICMSRISIEFHVNPNLQNWILTLLDNFWWWWLRASQFSIEFSWAIHKPRGQLRERGLAKWPFYNIGLILNSKSNHEGGGGS